MQFGAEKGQTLVLVALGLVALLAAVALAVDVGNAYSVRRQMQNSADAGALAGARALCNLKGVTEATNTARNQATSLNDYDRMVTATIRVYDTVSSGGTVIGGKVQVTSSTVADTFIAGIIGVNTISVAADATAACGAADKAGCGMWPIAFKKDLWDGLAARGTGTPFYVWTGDKWDPQCEMACDFKDNDSDGKVDKDDPNCDGGDCTCDCDEAWDAAPTCGTLPTECDCTSVKPSIPNPVIFTESGRAWLDFTTASADTGIYGINCASSTGCGASELKCWIAQDFDGKLVIPPGGVCVDGDSGVKAGTKTEIGSREYDLVNIPIYDYVCGSGIRCKDRYHIVQLGCTKVPKNPWVQNVTLDFNGSNKTCWKGKLIRLEVGAGCATECGGTSGGPPGPGTLNSVSLID
jgi:hypothetical protein